MTVCGLTESNILQVCMPLTENKYIVFKIATYDPKLTEHAEIETFKWTQISSIDFQLLLSSFVPKQLDFYDKFV